jgi:hypothetical protein
VARTSIATDDFNRADGPVGSDWSYIRNTAWTADPPDIASNTLTARANTGNYQVCRWNGSGTFTDDQYAKLEVGGLGYYGNGYRQGVVARCSADQDTAADYYAYYIYDDASSNRTAILFKVVNGTYTALDTSTANAWANGDTIEIEVEGTTVRGLKNGTELVSVTDSDLSTGKPGFAIGGEGGGPPNADNWEGGNLASAATAVKRSLLLGIG